jgi:hypothetical protein
MYGLVSSGENKISTNYIIYGCGNWRSASILFISLDSNSFYSNYESNHKRSDNEICEMFVTPVSFFVQILTARRGCWDWHMALYKNKKKNLKIN